MKEMKKKKLTTKSTPPVPQRKRGGLVERKNDGRVALFMVPASAHDLYGYTLEIRKPRPGGHTDMQVETGGTDSVTIEMPGGSRESDIFFLAMMYAMNVAHDYASDSLKLYQDHRMILNIQRTALAEVLADMREITTGVEEAENLLRRIEDAVWKASKS